MFKLQLLLVFLFVPDSYGGYVWQAGPTYSNYRPEPDEMEDYDKIKILFMARELVLDAKTSQRQLKDVIPFHETAVSFEVGLIMGTIREKYRRMMDIYKETYYRNKNTKSGKFVITPMVPRNVTHEQYVDPKYFILQMELVHTMEVEIDQLIRVIEAIPANNIFSDPKNIIGRSGKELETLREGTTPLPKSQMDPAPGITSNPPSESAEERLKQTFRDDFYRAKGFNPNWTLDEYYGII